MTDSLAVHYRDLAIKANRLATYEHGQTKPLRERITTLEAALRKALKWLPDSNAYEHDWAWDECGGDDQESVKAARKQGNRALTQTEETK